ncbi:MAG: PAS domain-containing protein [Actinocatenispora sp.]
MALVRAATEPCLVLDRSGLVAACSPAAGRLLEIPGIDTVIGKSLLDGIPAPVDFTASGDRLSEWELARLPPLLALATGSLARGLIRFRVHRHIRTVDAVSTPLRDHAEIAGSLTFFAAI